MAIQPIIMEYVQRGVHLRVDASQLTPKNDHQALRLFNGFYEGCPEIVIDLYGNTLLVYNYAEEPESFNEIVTQSITLCRDWISTIQCAVVKTRNTDIPEHRMGEIRFGTPDRWIQENNTRYALDLTMNQDASFYLDTRNLRTWLSENMAEKSVLNTFAYTGSLGIAAAAGGASRVVQMDLNRNFLNLAKTSCTLNGFPIHKPDFMIGEFHTIVKRLNRGGERFNCVVLDPPFFSQNRTGMVDIQQNYHRLINKVRPLITNDGYLVAINNAVFLSGAEYVSLLEALCRDGYLSIERLIPVPVDMTGFQETQVTPPPVNPAPFNHPTKIAVLKVRRKHE